jgi:hypothetical protein
MALTYAQPEKVSIGGRWQTFTDVTLDASYPTGGYQLDATKLGLPDGLLDRAFSDHGIPVGGATAFSTKITKAGKLQLYRGGGAISEPHAELPNATNVSTITVAVVAIGR